jgi:hypothetical protein
VGTISRGDPVLAVDHHAGLDGLGNPMVHLAHMMTPVPPIGNPIIQIYLSTSVDGGRSFPAGAATRVSTPTGGAGDDKPWIAVDQRGGDRPPDGNAYVCWSRITTNASGFLTTSQILLSQIPPGGPPGPEIPITTVKNAPRFVQSCQVAVDIEGHVYVAWTEFLSDATNTPNLMIRHASPPTGADSVSFDPPVPVEQIRGASFGIPTGMVNCTAPNWLPQGNRGSFLYDFVINASSLATNPFNGEIYLAWSMWNGPASSNGASRFDIFLKRGDRPGGRSDWDRRIGINQDVTSVTDQFMPSVTTYPQPVAPVPLLVEPTVGVAWSDKRNSGAANNAFEIFGSASPFSSDAPVSDAGPEPMVPAGVNTNCRIGDYNGLTSGLVNVGTPDGNGPGTYFLHAWGDTRGNGVNDPEVSFASTAFTPDLIIEIPPIFFPDLQLVLFAPQIPSLEFPVGERFPVPVDIGLFNDGAIGPTINTWIAVMDNPKIDVSLKGGQADACFGPAPPERKGPAAAVIGVPCDKGPIKALATETLIDSPGRGELPNRFDRRHRTGAAPRRRGPRSDQ